MAKFEFAYTEIDELLYSNIEIDEKLNLMTWASMDGYV